MNSTSYKENLKLLVAKGDKQKALGKLLLSADKQDNRVKNLIYSLSGDFKEYKHKLTAGIISQESSQLLNNSLRLRLLELIDQIGEEVPVIEPKVDAKPSIEFQETIKEHQLLKEKLVKLQQEQKGRLEVLEKDHNQKAQQLELVYQEKLALEQLVAKAKAKELAQIEENQQKQEENEQKLIQTQIAQNALKDRLATLEQQASKAQIEQEEILLEERLKLAEVLKEKEALRAKIAAVQQLSEKKQLDNESKAEQLKQFEIIQRDKAALEQQLEVAKRLEIRTIERLQLEQENRQLLIDQERKEKETLTGKIAEYQQLFLEEDRKNKLLNAEIQEQLDLVHQEKELLEIQLIKAKKQESHTIQQLESEQQKREKELEKERREKVALQKKLRQLQNSQLNDQRAQNGRTDEVSPLPTAEPKSAKNNWIKYVGMVAVLLSLVFLSSLFFNNTEPIQPKDWAGTWKHSMYAEGKDTNLKTGTVQFSFQENQLSGKVTTFYNGGNVELQLKNIEISNSGQRLSGAWESEVFYQGKPKTGLFEFNFTKPKIEFSGNSTTLYPKEEMDKAMIWKGVKR